MIRVFENLTELSRAAAALICNAAKKNIEEKGIFSLVLSGGETPRATYDLLSSVEFRNKIDWRNVKIFFGDERYVSHTDQRSNFRMASEALLNHVPVSSENIFPIPTDSSPEMDAIKYEKLLKNNFPASFPEFDLVLLGIGENGHTASLFPYTKVLSEKEKWVSEVFVEEQKEFRITLTAPAINNSKQIVFLVSGKNKASVLRLILKGEKNTQFLPAQLIHPNQGEMIWMTDKDSASLLNS